MTPKTLNICGLILSFIGGLLLLIDFWSISSRFHGDGLNLSSSPIRNKWYVRWSGRFGVALMTIGFLLQLLAQLRAR
jgi:TRAP-type C4-dicarboxylate transport system permease small subunit